MSDLDYDAHLTDGEREAVEAALTYARRYWQHGNEPETQAVFHTLASAVDRLLDLAQRAEAAEAAVEQVRALVRQGFNRGSLSWADSGDLFAALDPKADQ